MKPRRVALVTAAVVLLAGCSTAISGQPAPAPGISAALSTPAGASTLPAITEPSVPPTPAVPSSSPLSASPLSSSPLSSGAVPTAPLGSTPAGSTSPTSAVEPSSTPRPDGAAGSAGIGDPYYPLSGNGGYEVDSYDIDVTYDPVSNRLAGTTAVALTVTEAGLLGSFHLDLQPTMTVSAVRVGGKAAPFAHQGAELIVTPTAGLQPGSKAEVDVTYTGRPAQIPGGAANLGDGGWYRTPSGGAIAIGEPFSGSAWYPVNEHPSDPASYQVTATVPQKWSVISNGLPSAVGLPAAPAGMKVFRWVQTHPITSYEATIYIDTFSTVKDTTVDGKPIISVFAPTGDVAKYKKLATDTKHILQVLSTHFGSYPFASAGGIYTGQKLTFALETATRPVYADWVDTDTIVHELTHQWFGDDVVIQRWSDICLNECFASYGPWLWHQDVDKIDLDAVWVRQMADPQVTDPQFWSSPLVDMGAGNEFTAVYSRGPLAIHALRKQMGEKPFAALLKGWPATYGGKAASWADLVAYVNKLSGQNLTAFINAWFVGTTMPPAQYLHPGGIGR